MEAFLQCANCKKILFSAEFEQQLRVCPHCGHHHRLSAEKRIELTFDEGSFQEMDTDLRSVNVLQFPDYQDKLAAAEAKLFASEVSSRVTNAAVQVHGGYGYVTEYPVERFLRDAKLTEIGEGTSQVQRLVIGRKILGLRIA